MRDLVVFSTAPCRPSKTRKGARGLTLLHTAPPMRRQPASTGARVSCDRSGTASDRRIAKRAQDRVDACLIAWPLCLEPFENVLVDSKRYRRFRGQRPQPSPNDATHDVPDIGFGMLFGRRRRGSLRPEARPVSSGFHRRRFVLHGRLLCGTR